MIISNNLKLTISETESILTEKFSGHLAELSFISKNINMQKLLNISQIKVKGTHLFLYSLENSEISLNINEADSVSYYNPGSLVFIFKDGSTLTLRPLENLNKLKG